MLQTIRPILGESPEINQVLEAVRRASRSDSNVLITGETGTGKELVAQHIHYQKFGAVDTPFVTINCPAITDTLMQSSLFGHRRGSFTGAEQERKGYLREADSGTALFDEIGDASPTFQKTVLRFLESGEIQPVGDDRTKQVKVRVLASTNRDLRKLIDEQAFRSDLFFRLNVMMIRVPPLRQRKGDIPLLAQYYLGQVNHRYETSVKIESSAYESFMDYDWPGNVRELAHTMERLVQETAGRGVIMADDFQPVHQNTSVDIPLLDQVNIQIAEEYVRGLNAGKNFWNTVFSDFMDRDITRAVVKEVIRIGLRETRGNYKVLCKVWNLPEEDYKRLLNFLRKHGCHVRFQEFRN